MWFKKKSVLLAENHYNTEKSADGSTDLRTTSHGYINGSPNSGIPSVADADNYFYLPALGWYTRDKLYKVGSYCYYWSSSAHSSIPDKAYYLGFDNSIVKVSDDLGRNQNGFRVGAFE